MIKTLRGSRLASHLEGKEVIQQVAKQLVLFSETSCRSFKVRSSGCEQQNQDGKGTLQEGKSIKERYITQCGRWIKPLTEHAMLEKDYELGEKCQDY